MAGNLKAAELRRLLRRGIHLARHLTTVFRHVWPIAWAFPALYMTGYGATSLDAGIADAGWRPLFRHVAAPR